MKTKRTIKIVLVLFFTGSFLSSLYAQPGAPWTQMEEEPTTVDTVTAGVPIPYFVMPDPVLNDQFNANYDTSLTKAAQNIESSWNWFIGTSAAGGSSITKEGGGGEADGPYVEVTWAVNGGAEDTIYTSEVSGPPANCDGDSNFVRTVVLAAPDMSVRDNAATDTVYYCDGIGTLGVTLDNIVDNGVAGGNMNIRFDMQVDSLQSDLAGVLGNVSSKNDSIVQIAQTSGNDITFLNVDFQAVNGNITEYVFAFDNSLDATNQNGINDHISRKSDFLSLTDKTGLTSSEYTYYAPTSTESDVIVVRVFPAPSTGSIYYIPNDFNK